MIGLDMRREHVDSVRLLTSAAQVSPTIYHPSAEVARVRGVRHVPGTRRALTLHGGTDAVLRAGISRCGPDCGSLGCLRCRGGCLPNWGGVFRDCDWAFHRPPCV